VARERNEKLHKNYLSGNDANAENGTRKQLQSTNTKIELEIAKTQFMRSISDSFHELETEERKRRIRMLRETEDRIKTTEELRKRAREQWHEEMMLKEALAQKEVQLRLAEEEIKKEALERQLMRKKFENEQFQRRRVLQDQAAIAMEQFKYREESTREPHHTGNETGLNMLHKEVSRIYERPTSELRVSSFDSGFRGPPPSVAETPARRASYSHQNHHSHHHYQKQSDHHTTPHRTQPPRDEHLTQREPAPEVPRIKLRDVPRKAMSESLSESNMTMTEDEVSTLEGTSRKQPSDESVYYQDGYSTVNESVEETPAASSYTKFKQERRQQVQPSPQHHLPEEHRSKRPRIPHHQAQRRENVDEHRVTREQISHRTLTNIDDSLVHEDSVEDEFETAPSPQKQKPQVDNQDKEFMKAFRKSLQQEMEPININEPPLSAGSDNQRVHTPPPEMIDSARREKENRTKQGEQASIYTPQFDDVRESNPTATSEAKKELVVESPQHTTQKLEESLPTSTIASKPTSPTDSRSASPPRHAVEQANEAAQGVEESKPKKKKPLLSMSRLKKSRTKRSPKQPEPVPEVDEKSESEQDYYTTESGSEAPQSILERKACSQVRRHLQSTFPVKIVMGLKDLATSIEDDMSKQYTKGSLSSRLRKRNTNAKYPFPYEKRFAGRDSPLRDYDGNKRVALIEAAIDSDEEILEKTPYPVKSELFLDIIKYTPSVFVTKQLYERLFDTHTSLEDWTPEFMEQKCQIRGPTLEMWKVIISHIKFLYKTDSSKKNHVVSAFAAVLTPRPSAKLGTDFIKNRDETVERMKKLIKYACGAKKKGRLSIGGFTGANKRKSDSPSLKKSSPHSQTQSSLFNASKDLSHAPKPLINKSKSSGIILGGRSGGGSAFGGSSILNRLKTGQDLEDDDEDDDDDLNVAVFQAPASSGFGLGGVSFGRSNIDTIGEDDFDEFDL